VNRVVRTGGWFVAALYAFTGANGSSVSATVWTVGGVACAITWLLQSMADE
jgi:hypothetical protein